ncbi:hypothetical protein D3C87_753920 [compost metagenome]
MRNVRKQQIGWAIALTTVIALPALTACGAAPTGRQPATTTSKKAAAQYDPNDPRLVEPTPTSWNQDPNDVPTNIPQGIPTPPPATDPGEIAVSAQANTAASSPLMAVTGSNYRQISITATLKWTKVDGASQYRVSRSDDGSERFVVRSMVPGSYTAFRDGGGFANLAVGNEYKYLVEALDHSGQVIARGNDNVKPLYPLDVPALKGPDNGKSAGSLQPVLRWSYSDADGRAKEGPDGFYVEVFSGTYLVPMWRGYRQGTLADSIMYGDQPDFYPGTKPAIYTGVLQPGARYTWTVTAYKTDTGNAMTAKAIAKSNAPAWSFLAGSAPTQGGK